MKKKILSVCCVALLVFSMPFFSTRQVQAATDEPVLDGSVLIQEEESVGYDTKITKGEDLLAGYSKIVRLGPGKIYAGGTTLAAHTVESSENNLSPLKEHKKEILLGKYMMAGRRK